MGGAWRRPDQGGGTSLSSSQLEQLSSAHAPARLSPTAPIADALTAAPLVVDGVAVAAGDRILRTLDGADNGIWEVVTPGTGADGVWKRAEDYNTDELVENTVILFVQEGATHADSYWRLDTNPPITIDTTALVYTKLTFGGGGGDNDSVLVFGAGSVGSSPTTRYLYPSYEDDLAQTAVVQIRIPYAGTLRRLRVRHNQTSGNGNAIVYTVRVNNVASALSVSLLSTIADGSDLVNTIAVAAGDLVDIEVTKDAGVASSPTDIAATLDLLAA